MIKGGILSSAGSVGTHTPSKKWLEIAKLISSESNLILHSLHPAFCTDDYIANPATYVTKNDASFVTEDYIGGSNDVIFAKQSVSRAHNVINAKNTLDHFPIKASFSIVGSGAPHRTLSVGVFPILEKWLVILSLT